MLEVGLVGHKNAKSILFKVCKPMVYGRVNGRVKHNSTFQPTFNYAPIGPISPVFRALSPYLSTVRNDGRGIDRPIPQICWAAKPAAGSPKLLSFSLPPPFPPTKSASTEHTGYVRGHRVLVALGLRSCWPWRLMPR